ncbi:hypothetical protein AVEN_77265-1 [Araneus ventricosus]|uniref:Uncharacterized protein n=1 Tax=Araneus ventricosus TaxID=182803 RepID=A0A4Y2UMQ7_ARAVE|nr:hypothetical protein AVEN_77265-1 [Araneus ventricosus]
MNTPWYVRYHAMPNDRKLIKLKNTSRSSLGTSSTKSRVIHPNPIIICPTLLAHNEGKHAYPQATPNDSFFLSHHYLRQTKFKSFGLNLLLHPKKLFPTQS